MIRWIPLLLGLLLLTFASPDNLQAAAYYLKAAATAGAGGLTTGDLLADSTPLSPQLAAAELDLPPGENTLSILGSAYVTRLLRQHSNEPVLLVGSHTIVVPAGLAGEEAFYRALGRYFLTQETVTNQRLDLEIRTPPSPPITPGDYRFTLLEHNRVAGRLSGPARLYYENRKGSGGFLELSCSRTDSTLEEKTGDPAPAERGLAPSPDNPAEVIPKLVKGGEIVTIHFYRNNIHLKMEGRAFSSGVLGDRVTVKPTTTNRRFEGTVTGAKEVRVEMD